MDTEIIRAQVERIVVSEPFRKSNRYPRLLKFIVEQTLAGNADLLKERSLGIEVFDRPPDYELRTDPIVRVAAGELRKRLAQYYIQSNCEKELRIELQPGSYVPEFHWPQHASSHATDSLSDPVDPTALTVLDKGPRRYYKRPWVVAGALLLLIASAAVFVIGWTRTSSASRKFWEPLLKADKPPLICIGDRHDLLDNSPGNPEATLLSAENSHLSGIVDVDTANQVSEILVSLGKRASLQNSSLTTLQQLSQQPVILIGWRGNQWSQRATQLLRFRLTNVQGDQVRKIVDTQNPLASPWLVDPEEQSGATYAIIARFQDSATGQPTILIAGIGSAGTTAAARFITNSQFLDSFANVAPRDWEKKNVELVIETHVVKGINGPSGAPRLAASYVW